MFSEVGSRSWGEGGMWMISLIICGRRGVLGSRVFCQRRVCPSRWTVSQCVASNRTANQGLQHNILTHALGYPSIMHQLEYLFVCRLIISPIITIQQHSQQMEGYTWGNGVMQSGIQTVVGRQIQIGGEERKSFSKKTLSAETVDTIDEEIQDLLQSWGLGIERENEGKQSKLQLDQEQTKIFFEINNKDQLSQFQYQQKDQNQCQNQYKQQKMAMLQIQCQHQYKQQKMAILQIQQLQQQCSQQNTSQLQQYKGKQMVTLHGKQVQNDVIERVKPLRGLYYDNRQLLINWLNDYCKEFRLSRATYSSALQWMDSYFSMNLFQSSTFTDYSLSCLILASKVHEYLVLSTAIVAKHEQIPLPQLILAERQMLKHMRFRVSRQSYSIVLGTLMGQMQQRTSNRINFFDQLFQSYFAFRKVFYLADMHTKHNKCTTLRQLKLIFLELFPTEERVVEELFRGEIGELMTYELHCGGDSDFQEYMRGVRGSLRKWRGQIEGRRGECEDRFRGRKGHYGQFINFQI